MKIRTYLRRIIKWLTRLRSHGIRWGYYKYIYAKKIFKTKPIVCESEGLFEVHTLTCEQDLANTLWSLKTFYHFCELRPKLIIYEDGSLSNNSKSILSEHFLNCQIIRRDRFHHDMENFLKAYKSSLEYSKLKSFYCIIKLLGPMYYTKSERLLYLDSDVLFFKKPGEILKFIENGIPFYMSDYQDAYSHPLEFLKNLVHIGLAHKINAGLFHVAKRDFADHLDLVNFYFEKVPQIGNNDWRVNRHEQTLTAILLSKANGVRLSNVYQISKEPVTDKTISHHFVNDGSRQDFYSVGLRHLRSSGFIEEFEHLA